MKKEVADFVEFADADDIWIRFYTIPKTGYFVPQHAHKHDHITLLCSGAVNAFKDDVFIGEFVAPKSLVIEAGTKHRFETLTPNVLLACVHNMRGREGSSPEVTELHEI